jgi:PAS domain-containing protein
MDWGYIITALATAVTTVVGQWGINRATRKKERRDDFQELKDGYADEYNRLKTEIDTIKQKEEECTQRNLELEGKFMKLSAQFRLFQISKPQLEAPAWVKDPNGVMLALNDAYEKAYLIPLGKTREDYIGKNDIEMWGAEIGEEYMKLDKRVILEGRPLSTIEPLHTRSGIKSVYVIKYPLTVPGVEGQEPFVMGIGGQTVEPHLVQDMFKKYKFRKENDLPIPE